MVGRTNADGRGAEILGCAERADTRREMAALALDGDWVYVLIDPLNGSGADVRRFRR